MIFCTKNGPYPQTRKTPILNGQLDGQQGQGKRPSSPTWHHFCEPPSSRLDDPAPPLPAVNFRRVARPRTPAWMTAAPSSSVISFFLPNLPLDMRAVLLFAMAGLGRVRNSAIDRELLC